MFSTNTSSTGNIERQTTKRWLMLYWNYFVEQMTLPELYLRHHAARGWFRGPDWSGLMISSPYVVPPPSPPPPFTFHSLITSPKNGVLQIPYKWSTTPNLTSLLFWLNHLIQFAFTSLRKCNWTKRTLSNGKTSCRQERSHTMTTWLLVATVITTLTQVSDENASFSFRRCSATCARVALKITIWHKLTWTPFYPLPLDTLHAS